MKSMKKIAKQLDVSHRSLRKIVKTNLGLKPFKILLSSVSKQKKILEEMQRVTVFRWTISLSLRRL